jgi:decaprenylphospho-beta-D-erythro-pentofuranosid-2-ulose 2-reductase
MGDPKLNGNVLILGATSDVAAALAAKYASERYSLTLAARDIEKLEVMGADLRIRYNVPVHLSRFDALNFKSHVEFFHSLSVKPDIAICVFGFLGEQSKAEVDWSECALIIDSNYTGAVSILNVIANEFVRRGGGVIVGISSVAGDRGRQSNFIYGSAKAGFTAYLSGLRNRLYKHNVHVLTVIPGFMKTRMTEGMKTPKPITASPDVAAGKIFRAAESRKDVIYVTPIWWLIMLVIKSIPEGIFKKLKL